MAEAIFNKFLDRGIELQEFQFTSSVLDMMHSEVFASFSPDGSRMVTVNPFDMRIWDTATWTTLYRFPQIGNIITKKVDGKRIDETVHEGSFSARTCDIGPDGRSLLIGDSRDGLKIWDMVTKKALKHIKTHVDSITMLNLTSDGKTLLTSGPRLWDLTTGSVSHQIPGSSMSIASGISGDGLK